MAMKSMKYLFAEYTNSNNETQEYIRSSSYTNMENTTYYPTVNLGSYSGNIQIKNSDESVTLTENTDYTYSNGIVTFLNELEEPYTIYAVESGSIFAGFIKDIIKDVTPDSEGIYTGAAGDGCTNTLIYDETDDNNLRYVGTNPCNFVKFNCNFICFLIFIEF